MEGPYDLDIDDMQWASSPSAASAASPSVLPPPLPTSTDARGGGSDIYGSYGDLPDSYATAGVYSGLVPTVGFALLVLNFELGRSEPA